MDDYLDLVVFVLWVLALARLTRLVNADEITDPIRLAVMRKTGPESKWSYFLQCPWCVSMWLGLVTAGFPVWLTDSPWWFLPLLALAGSHVTGLMAQLDTSELEIEVQED